MASDLPGTLRLCHELIFDLLCGYQNPRSADKAIVMGILHRGGKIHAKVVPNAKKDALWGEIRGHVDSRSTVYTDEAGHYLFPPLSGGSYKIWAQAVGFEPARAEAPPDQAAAADCPIGSLRSGNQ